MARKSRKQRNVEQRERSENNRIENRERRRPSRDDLARVLLWQTIHGFQTRYENPRWALDALRDQIVDVLLVQHFDLRESEEMFEDLVVRYAKDILPFRIKRHLGRSPNSASKA